ncbi:hypothetical protein BMS3Bbin16_00522 [archaeon BMS3Bbin16]|nr:hypothetical protein BMS3Bbin16_00522 [archaeon BMS3Bbin16]
MDHWNRSPPIPLPRDKPVPKLKVNSAPAPAPLLRKISNRLLGILISEAIKHTGIYHHTITSVGSLQSISIRSSTLWNNHNTQGQTVFPGKLKIPLVMSWNSHHSTGAIFIERVISNPDRTAFPGKRIDKIPAEKHAGLLPALSSALNRALTPHTLNKLPNTRLHLRSLHILKNLGMLSGKHKISNPINSVRASCKRLNLINHTSRLINHIKAKRYTHAAPDPILLHKLNTLRPIQTIHTVQKLLRILCGFNKPLLKISLLHLPTFMPPTPAIMNLLIRKNRRTL